MGLTLPRECPELKRTDPEGKDPAGNFCFFYDLDDNLEMADYGQGSTYGCIHCKYQPFEDHGQNS
jgi:hypothetical protein